MPRQPLLVSLSLGLAALLALPLASPLEATAAPDVSIVSGALDEQGSASVDDTVTSEGSNGDDPTPTPSDEPVDGVDPDADSGVDSEAEGDTTDDVDQSTSVGERAAEPIEVSRALTTTAAGTPIGPAPGVSAPSSAGPGAAPAPAEHRVIAGVHTDLVSTFFDAGSLAIGSKADVAEGNGTRFSPSTVLFHLEADSAQAVPSGFDFIGSPGSTVWIAPETNPGHGALWPGFSTESVPAGALDGDETTFSLIGFSGPGDLELYRGSGASLERLWSTDEGIAAFTVTRTHLHANWAFTAAGTYRLQVRASASVGGSPVSASTVYTIVVGELPPAVATSVALDTSASTVLLGEDLVSHATVTPSGASGYLELRDGTTALWHTPVVDGAASVTVSDLALGNRSLTAAFVPAVSNLFAASVSEPVSVTVTNDSGDIFAVHGVENPYEPGDTLQVSLGGYTLADGETVRWRLRPVGSDSVNGSTLTTAASLNYSATIDLSWHGYEISAQVRQGTTVIATTDWAPLVVERPAGDELSLNLVDAPSPFYMGDNAIVRYAGLGTLDEGESMQLVLRSAGGRWSVLTAPGFASLPIEYLDDERISLTFNLGASGGTWDIAVRVVQDGVVVRHSQPLRITIGAYELELDGLRSAYRDGQTLRVSGVYHPIRDGVDVSYQWSFRPVGQPLETLTGVDGDPSTIERALSLADDGGRLQLLVVRGETSLVALASATIIVAEDNGERIFTLEALSGHYHQGSAVNLRLTVEPELEPADSVRWEWLWPGSQEWGTLPAAEGLTHSVVAEQALHGVQVRAVLVSSDDSIDAITTHPRTILVDDHGAAPRQQLSVTGPDVVNEGEQVVLSAEVSTPSVLDTYRWERKRLLDDDFAAIEGVTGASLAFGATLADNGAEYRVSLVTPSGLVAYGPSASTAFTVEAASEFSLVGIEPVYSPGDVLSATVVGHSLESGESFRWHIRPIGSTSAGATLHTGTSTTLALPLNISHDGYEVRTTVRQGSTTIDGTAWYALSIQPGPGASVSLTSSAGDGPIYVGDFIDVTAAPADLAEGDRYEWVYRTANAQWTPLVSNAYWIVEHDDTNHMRIAHSFGGLGLQIAARVISDGVAVRQSDPVTVSASAFEITLEGVQTIYRDGRELRVTAEVYPDLGRDDLTVRWVLRKSGFADVVLHETVGSVTSTVVDTVSASSHDQANLIAQIVRNGVVVGQRSVRLSVTDQLDGQIFDFEALAGHYHQGYAVRLALVADPLPGDNDTIDWEWLWPDSDEWLTLAGASGIEHLMSAEQALDGVQVRATLTLADDPEQPMVAGPVTIYVDDHGAAPRQQLSVTGDTEVVAGEQTALSAALSTESVLDTYRWERQRVGDSDFTVLDDESGAELSTVVGLLDDGAQYRVALVTPAGAVAYGPSSPITLSVSAPPPAADSAARKVALTKGHIDFFEVTYDAELGGLVLNVKDDTQLYGPGITFRAPEDVTLWIDSGISALDTTTLPPAFSFLQVSETTYFLPQSQDQRLPWPGWSTERLMSSLPSGVQVSTSADAVRMTVEVSGPGEVFTWQTGAFGNVINQFIDTTNPAPNVITAGRNVHVHTNWAFSELGTYTFTVTPSATTTTGGQLAGVSSVYRVHVGPAQDAAPNTIVAPSVIGSGAVGEALSADLGSWLPLPHSTHLEWVRNGEVIEGATGSTFTPVWTDLDSDIAVRVTATVGDVSTIETSASVTIVQGSAPQETDESPVPDEQLIDDTRGDVTVTTTGPVHPSSQFSLHIDGDMAGDWVSLWLHSDPVWLGWAQVNGEGIVRSTLPASTPVGQHRVVVKSHGGDLIGWAPLTVVPAPQPPPAEEPNVQNEGAINACVGSARVISAGHVDYSTRIINGRVQSLIGDDTGGTKVYREPSGVVLWLKPSSAVTLPSGFGQIGAAGATVWQVPQTQNPNLIWLGWSTEGLNSASVSGAVDWRLDSVSGPGSVKVYTTGSFGGVQSMVLNGAGSRYSIPLGVHAHANWAFSAQGVYRLTMTQTVTLANGTRSSDTETLTIAVGNVDPASVASGGSGCGTVANALLTTDADADIELTDESIDNEGVRSIASTDDVESGEAATAASEATSAIVPVLIAVLIGLLLIGAAGAGVLWWRRRAAAG